MNATRRLVPGFVGALCIAAGSAGQQGPNYTDVWLDDIVVIGNPAKEQPDPGVLMGPEVAPMGDIMPVDGIVFDYPPGTPERVYLFDVLTGRLVETITPTVVPGEEENATTDPDGEPPPPVAPETGARGGDRALSSYSIVGDTTDYPYRRTVRLIMVYMDNEGDLTTSSCSGTMVDSRHVLTAAHCLYNHDFDDEIPVAVYVFPGVDDDDASASTTWWCNQDNFNNDPDCDELDAPVYDEGDFPFGGASATHIWITNGWADDENLTYDVGWLRVDRPVGALTGWSNFGYSAAVCSWWENAFWWNDGYPAEPDVFPFEGYLMHERSGDFDSCPAPRRKRTNEPSWGGSSGSAAVRSYNGSRTAFAVLSTSDRTSRTDFCRLTDGSFYGLQDDISDARPSSADVIPLKVRTSTESILAGETLFDLTYKIHNYSESQSFNRDMNVRVYLSTNRKITANDTLIGSRYIDVNIPKMQTANVTAQGPYPTIPQYTPPGQYYIGVILDPDIDDSDTSNNNTKRWDSTPITVTGLANLWAQFIAITPGKYQNGQSIPVNFSVKNLGNIGSGAITGDFYASQNLSLGPEDVLLASGGAGNIAPNQATQFNDNIPINGLSAGLWHMILYVDSENGESDYSNNWAIDSTPFEVSSVCDGDADFNFTVNVNDISYVVFRLGDSGPVGGPPVPGDVDGNNVVNVNDISYVVFRLGINCI